MASASHRRRSSPSECKTLVLDGIETLLENSPHVFSPGSGSQIRNSSDSPPEESTKNGSMMAAIATSEIVSTLASPLAGRFAGCSRATSVLLGWRWPRSCELSQDQCVLLRATGSQRCVAIRACARRAIVPGARPDASGPTPTHRHEKRRGAIKPFSRAADQTIRPVNVAMYEEIHLESGRVHRRAPQSAELAGLRHPCASGRRA